MTGGEQNPLGRESSCTKVQKSVQKRMRSTPLHRARAQFSKLIDRALAGEPQRVTRHGKEAVVIVSEKEWIERAAAATETLGSLLAEHARTHGFSEDDFDRPWNQSGRELGADFLD